MKCSRRQFFAALGLALGGVGGCGPSKQESTPNPDLGPPPDWRPPKRDTPPEAGDKKKK